MTRNEAIAIARKLRGPASVESSERSVWASGYEQAQRELLVALADAGAFEDGKNMADRIRPKGPV